MRAGRSNPLARRTPLAPGGPLARSSTRIRARSGRAAAFAAGLDAARGIVRARSGGRCEAGVPDVCTGTAEQVHHRRLRRQGGTNDPVNLLDICGACHTWAHANPEAGYRTGVLVPAWAEPAEWPLDISMIVEHDDASE